MESRITTFLDAGRITAAIILLPVIFSADVILIVFDVCSELDETVKRAAAIIIAVTGFAIVHNLWFFELLPIPKVFEAYFIFVQSGAMFFGSSLRLAGEVALSLYQVPPILVLFGCAFIGFVFFVNACDDEEYDVG